MAIETKSARASRRKRRLRKKTGGKLMLVLAGLVGFLIIVYFVCIHSTPGESYNVTKGKVLGRVTSGKYRDDITRGYSKQWFVSVRVQVEFMHGEIRKIKVLSHRHIWPKAKKATQLIPKRIVEKQSTKVKAVSGATLSSKTIMLAVQDALDHNQKKNKWDPYEKTGQGGRWDDKY